MRSLLRLASKRLASIVQASRILLGGFTKTVPLVGDLLQKDWPNPSDGTAQTDQDRILARSMIMLSMMLSLTPVSEHALLRRSVLSSLVRRERTELGEPKVTRSSLLEALRACLLVLRRDPDDSEAEFGDLLERCGSMNHRKMGRLVSTRLLACAAV